MYFDPHNAPSQLNPHYVPGSGGWPATTSYQCTDEDMEQMDWQQFYDATCYQAHYDQIAHERAVAYGQHEAYGPVPKAALAPVSPFDYGKDQK